MPMHASRSSKDFNPFGELIGLSFSRMESGSSQCQLEVERKLQNPYGVVHGGVIYSLADTAMGGALHSCLAENQRCATVEMKISYLHAVTSGTLTCEAEVAHRSKRLAFVQSEVTADDRVVAIASATFSIIRSNPSPE